MMKKLLGLTLAMTLILFSTSGAPWATAQQGGGDDEYCADLLALKKKTCDRADELAGELDDDSTEDERTMAAAYMQLCADQADGYALICILTE